MRRYLVLFAREPAREAREKGFRVREAAPLFAAFAVGWLEAARRNDARLVVATLREDRGAWGRIFGSESDVLWIVQQGRDFGERLERAARQAAALGGYTVCVGGDVPPSSSGLRTAFEGLNRGLDAVLAPAPDGGVSLIGLRPDDLDLLGTIALRQRGVLDRLSGLLAGRGRSIGFIETASDVDDRHALRLLLRRTLSLPRSLLRRALGSARFVRREQSRTTLCGCLHGPPILRAPPLLA